MKKIFLLCLLTCLVGGFAAAQTADEFTWWNPANAEPSVIEGQAWTGKTIQSPYDRLPAEAENNVRKVVWNLSRNAAGLLIRFRASTERITVRYAVQGNQAMPHMPATGVSGVDLYAGNSDGNWLWCNGKYTFGDTIQYQFANLQADDPYHQKGREYRLHLPLYNSVKWLEIGVPKGVTVTPLPVRADKPIVVYGTSIAQGACASRPGMAWTAILGRKLDRPLINLAFSGNGRLEKEIVELLPQIDAKVYVLDCLPNLITTPERSAEEVKNRILESVRTLRQKRPATPILLVEHAGYTDGDINPVRKKAYSEVNEIMRQAFVQLKGEGIGQLYLLPKSQINLDTDAMVDGTHPSDLGMQQYADAYERALRTILNEPSGEFSTMKPLPQSRDSRIYDWETRHREILARLKSHPPRIVYIGNSITHYWGGEPKAPRAQGADSWNTMLEPLGVQNLGYGWDRIENALWRVYHGELDGYQAAQVVLMIGTNNLQWNSNAEIAAGLKHLIQAVQVRQPGAEILLIGILPRRNEEQRLMTLNEELAQVAGETNIKFAQPGTVFLKPDGKIDESLFTDGLHPNAEGYRRLAAQLVPHLKKESRAGSKNKKSDTAKRTK
ncbi:lysophospholipase L1-like esterase [Larkinella arboricola]|uniref:Lysophospholipase L1-like esterase n=1 Tax=Larkinella arboricola TaxID=643671 RepID=A0A327WSR3_LARAB|nr:SGNH/GDSL hydrolase family protein [Larkinella arboricola]RAJ95503.1 lysophospholipase L1-like esterase [Larkinella arboricola]